jgi:hypothetical protein
MDTEVEVDTEVVEFIIQLIMAVVVVVIIDPDLYFTQVLDALGIFLHTTLLKCMIQISVFIFVSF